METSLLAGAGLAALVIIGGTIIAWRIVGQASDRQPESLRAVAEIIRAFLGRKA